MKCAVFVFANRSLEMIFYDKKKKNVMCTYFTRRGTHVAQQRMDLLLSYSSVATYKY